MGALQIPETLHGGVNEAKHLKLYKDIICLLYFYSIMNVQWRFSEAIWDEMISSLWYHVFICFKIFFILISNIVISIDIAHITKTLGDSQYFLRRKRVLRWKILKSVAPGKSSERQDLESTVCIFSPPHWVERRFQENCFKTLKMPQEGKISISFLSCMPV